MYTINQLPSAMLHVLRPIKMHFQSRIALAELQKIENAPYYGDVLNAVSQLMPFIPYLIKPIPKHSVEMQYISSSILAGFCRGLSKEPIKVIYQPEHEVNHKYILDLGYPFTVHNEKWSVWRDVLFSMAESIERYNLPLPNTSRLSIEKHQSVLELTWKNLRTNFALFVQKQEGKSELMCVVPDAFSMPELSSRLHFQRMLLYTQLRFLDFGHGSTVFENDASDLILRYTLPHLTRPDVNVTTSINSHAALYDELERYIAKLFFPYYEQYSLALEMAMANCLQRFENHDEGLPLFTSLYLQEVQGLRIAYKDLLDSTD